MDRPHTSEKTYVRKDKPRQKTPRKVLKAKTYRFVEELWREFIEVLLQDTPADADTSIEDFEHEADMEQDSSFV